MSTASQPARVGPAGQDSLTRTLGAALRLAWRADRGAFGGRLAVTVLSGLAPVAAAWLLRTILDDLVARDQSRGNLLAATISLGVVGALLALLPNVGQYLSARSARATQRHSTTALFTAVNRLEGLRKFEDPGFYDQLNVAEQAGSSAPGQVFGNGVIILQAFLTLAGFLVTLAVLTPVIAGVVLLAGLPAVYNELAISRRRAALISGLSHSQRRQSFYANLLTDYAAAKEIRLFGLGPFFLRRMLAELRSIQRANERVDQRELAVYSGLASLSAAIAATGLLWVIFAAARGRLTVGDVSVFVAALGSVTSTLSGIIASAAMTYQALLTFRSYRAVVTEGPDLAKPVAAVPLPALRHGIELDDVWFRYNQDGPWVLRGVSCRVPFGRSVAFVGHNGVGKSTIVKLLCRFYDPDQGRILWDGVDLRDLDITDLRGRLSVVFQDFMSYELSASENIAVGDLSRAGNSEALTTAASRAGVHEVIAALPKGYDTLLTRTFFDLADRDDPQTGVVLSGGQWQRVGLARALLRADRDLLVLDEPSSGLDAEAEHEIHRRLHADKSGRTTVLISHRLNTVRDADQIVVLADGVVTEQGSHDALMTRSGIYARLFSLQASGFTARSAASAGTADD